MEGIMAIAIGLLFAAAFYMMLRRSIVKLVMGLIVLSNAANLVIFTVAGMTRTEPPFLDKVTKVASSGVADPLPQALILTAIVIAFGVLAFSVVLIHRAYKVVGTDDLDQMKDTDT